MKDEESKEGILIPLIMLVLFIGIPVIAGASSIFLKSDSNENVSNTTFKSFTTTLSSPTTSKYYVTTTPTTRWTYTPTYRGYVCTQDCSGHEAGYEWAEENDIEDPDDCGGNSYSFIEGCESYAEEQQSWYDSYDSYYEEEDSYYEDDYNDY